MLNYLRKLTLGRLILWCYFIWYLVVLVRYFDPNPRLWATSFGLALIIGLALCINAAGAGGMRFRIGFWPAFRFFMMPFCVSSFSALVKDRHFFLVFSSNAWEIAAAIAIWAVLCLARIGARVIPVFRP